MLSGFRSTHAPRSARQKQPGRWVPASARVATPAHPSLPSPPTRTSRPLPAVCWPPDAPTKCPHKWVSCSNSSTASTCPDLTANHHALPSLRLVQQAQPHPCTTPTTSPQPTAAAAARQPQPRDHGHRAGGVPGPRCPAEARGGGSVQRSRGRWGSSNSSSSSCGSLPCVGVGCLSDRPAGVCRAVVALCVVPTDLRACLALPCLDLLCLARSRQRCSQLLWQPAD